MARTITDELVRQAHIMTEELDRDCYNPFIYNDEVKQSYEKIYHWFDSELKVKRISEGDMGIVSDAYIMLAVALLKVATREDIQSYLTVMHSKYKELCITSVDDEDSLKKCLKRLIVSGLLFKHHYSYMTESGSLKHISLYTLSRGNATLMNAILEKNVKVMPYLQAKHLYSLIGLAASAHTAAETMRRSNCFYSMEEGTYRSKFIGGFSVAQELVLKDNDGQITKIGFHPVFLGRDSSYQTEADYNDFKIYLQNIIRNYITLNMQSTSDNTYMILTVRDKKDLEEFIEVVQGSPIMNPVLSHVYLTGYGLISGDYGTRFIQLYKRSEKEIITYSSELEFVEI